MVVAEECVIPAECWGLGAGMREHLAVDRCVGNRVEEASSKIMYRSECR